MLIPVDKVIRFAFIMPAYDYVSKPDNDLSPCDEPHSVVLTVYGWNIRQQCWQRKRLFDGIDDAKEFARQYHIKMCNQLGIDAGYNNSGNLKAYDY